MLISRWIIDPRSREDRQKSGPVISPNDHHRLVWRLFGKNARKDYGERPLFVYDSVMGKHRFIVLSRGETANPGFGELESKPLDEGIFGRSRYRFRITVNPVEHPEGPDGERAECYVPIMQEAGILAWFRRNAEKWGFFPESAMVEDKWRGAGGSIRLNMARIAGTLKVVDQEAFRRSAMFGIGRAKAWGCGLLQLS